MWKPQSLIYLLVVLTIILRGHITEGCIKAKLTVIGHRGGLAGPVPQHSLAAYSIGADLGADYLEPDLVFSKDGQFFCFHDLELSSSTDISHLPQFESYKKSKLVLEPNGVRNLTGWFADDLTAEEIKTLTLKSKTLTSSTLGKGPIDTQFNPVSFVEMLDLVEQLSSIYARPIGIYPELKNAVYFREFGYKPEETFLEILAEKGWLDKVITPNSHIFYQNKRFNNGKSLLIIQSFDVSALQRLSNLTDAPLVQLMMDNKSLTHSVKTGVNVPMYTREGLIKISTYASGIGSNFADLLDEKLKIVKLAKKYNLFVHAYTLGRQMDQYQLLAEEGVDGIFTDDVSVARIFNEQVEVCGSGYYTKIFGVVLVSFLWCLPFVWLIFLQITSAKKKKEKKRLKMKNKNTNLSAIDITSENVPMLERGDQESQYQEEFQGKDETVN